MFICACRTETARKRKRTSEEIQSLRRRIVELELALSNAKTPSVTESKHCLVPPTIIVPAHAIENFTTEDGIREKIQFSDDDQPNWAFSKRGQHDARFCFHANMRLRLVLYSCLRFDLNAILVLADKIIGWTSGSSVLSRVPPPHATDHSSPFYYGVIVPDTVVLLVGCTLRSIAITIDVHRKRARVNFVRYCTRWCAHDTITVPIGHCMYTTDVWLRWNVVDTNLIPTRRHHSPWPA
jgi:hypothetical protein